eukprot:COSAG01_NODE_3083_length_6620_cov_7.014415_5_plen_126_part_00
MPMVPCPECEVPRYRQKEPKAGARCNPCKECVAKRRQGEQLRKACREKECVVTCGRPGCGKEIALQRAPRRSTTSHVCGGCLAKEAVAGLGLGALDIRWCRRKKKQIVYRVPRAPIGLSIALAMA